MRHGYERRFVPWSLAAVDVAVLAGFAVFTRASLSQASVHLHTTFGYWDVVLNLIGSGYVFVYWVMPLAVWCALRQLQGSASPENLIRYRSRTDWAFHQGLLALRWIAFLVGTLFLVALLAGIGFPVTWRWEWAAEDASVLLQFPNLAPSMPLPVLSVILTTVALTMTLVGFVVVVAAVSACTRQPRAAAVAAVAMVLWGIVSFRTDTWVSGVFGLSTYALPWQAAVNLPFGPGGGVMTMVIVGVLGYLVATLVEVRGARLDAIPAETTALVVGALVLLGLSSRLPSAEDSAIQVSVLLLQGVGVEGMSLPDFFAATLLVLVPAIVVHRELVASLLGRRHQEMIRLGSPARWYWRRLGDAARVCAGYGFAMAAWVLVLVVVRAHTSPGISTLVVVGAWGLSLTLQALVVCVMLALGTALLRRVEGGACGVLVAVALSLPLGSVSRWTPTGQASVARMTDISQPQLASPRPLPLIVLACWLVALCLATLVLFNRTRGEVL